MRSNFHNTVNTKMRTITSHAAPLKQTKMLTKEGYEFLSTETLPDGTIVKVELYDSLMVLLDFDSEKNEYIVRPIDEDQVEPVNQEYIAYNYTHSLSLSDYCKLVMFSLDQSNDICDYTDDTEKFVNSPIGVIEHDLIDTIAYRCINFAEKDQADNYLETIEIPGYKVMVYSFPFELETSTCEKLGEFRSIRVIPTI